MPSLSIKKLSRLAAPAALCAGLLINGAAFAPVAQAAPALTPLEKLLIKEQIRENLVLYSLYADGDGPGGHPRNLRALAETLMTPDVVTEIHLATGGPPNIFTGRERVANTPPEIDPDRKHRVAGRHYLVQTGFDDISATTVHTRTTSVYFDATTKTAGEPCTEPAVKTCAGAPVKIIMWVYHMTWVKTPQGWQISKNILRDDN